MKEITVKELKALMDNGADFQLIDVREQHEAEIAEIGAHGRVLRFASLVKLLAEAHAQRKGHGLCNTKRPGRSVRAILRLTVAVTGLSRGRSSSTDRQWRRNPLQGCRP